MNIILNEYNFDSMKLSRFTGFQQCLLQMSILHTMKAFFLVMEESSLPITPDPFTDYPVRKIFTLF